MSYAVRTDRFRFAILLTRKPGMSKDEFSRYWAQMHGPLFAGTEIAQSHLLKYEQSHVNQEMLEAARTAGFAVPEWDGMVVLEAESHAKLMEVLQSDEFKKTAMGDAPNFVD
ncbi:hypothetical protein C8R45DRAFT_843659, partial [Mycena sanguinolenta]